MRLGLIALVVIACGLATAATVTTVYQWNIGRQLAAEVSYWQARTTAATNDTSAEKDARISERGKFEDQIKQLSSQTAPQRSAPTCAKTFIAYLQVPTKATAEAAYPCLTDALHGPYDQAQWTAKALSSQQSIGRDVSYMAGIQLNDGSWITAWADVTKSNGYLVYLDSAGKVSRLE